jgi:ATP citrate (pro-S)-lyase
MIVAKSNLSLAIREYDAKLLLAYWLERAPPVDSSAKVITNFTYPAPRVAQVAWDSATNTITPDTQLPGWVFSSKLVAKPDQLIKRRGKAGLLALNKTWEEAKEWIGARAGKPQQVRRHPWSSTFVLWDPIPWIWSGQGRDTTNGVTSVTIL